MYVFMLKKKIPISDKVNGNTGLQITTRPLANASKFSCGRLNYKNPLAQMASKNLPELFRIPLVI
jgi:hypothetical protein